MMNETDKQGTFMFKLWEEMTRKEQLEAEFWDAYKDAYGIRPRHINLSEMTEDELEKELVTLGEIIGRQELNRVLREAEAARKFEERILSVIETGAKDRETALRWIMEGAGYDAEYGWNTEMIEWEMGLPYGYLKESK